MNCLPKLELRPNAPADVRQEARRIETIDVLCLMARITRQDAYPEKGQGIHRSAGCITDSWVEAVEAFLDKMVS